MRPRHILTTTLFAALAAAPFFAMTSQPASAQLVVAATCPQGYVLEGNSCVKTGPSPSCPSGYTFSAGKCVTSKPAPTADATASGQWAFVTREAFGVDSATQLEGANFCAVAGAPAEDAKEFFNDNGISATHVDVENDRAAIEKYQKYDCDILVVAERVARSTADSLKPEGGHIVLPEKFGASDAAAQTPQTAKEQPVPLPPKKPATAEKPTAQPANVEKSTPPPAKAKKQPVRTKTAQRPRCSAIKYSYTRGNTCACAGGRIFTGRACVRPRWQRGR